MVDVKEVVNLNLKQVREVAEFLEIPNFANRSKNIIISAISKLPDEMDVKLKEFMGTEEEIKEGEMILDVSALNELDEESKEEPVIQGITCAELCDEIEKALEEYEKSDVSSFLSFVAFFDSKISNWHTIRNDINRRNAKPREQISW